MAASVPVGDGELLGSAPYIQRLVGRVAEGINAGADMLVRERKASMISCVI